MAKVFDGKIFALLGRMSNGTQADVSHIITEAGGSVTRNWTMADYLVADSPPDAQRERIERFEESGGIVVPSSWLSKSVDKGEIEEIDPPLQPSTTSTSPTGQLQGQGSLGSSAIHCTNKRIHDSEDDDCATQSTPTPSSNQASPPQKKTKQTSACSVGSNKSAIIRSSNPVLGNHEDLAIADLSNVIVLLDDHYLGSNSDEVLVDDQIWDFTLNQNNMKKNSNKFYIMQLTKTEKGSFRLFARWGRVGVVGQKSLATFNQEAAAKEAFERKFKEKTRWPWKDRFEQQVRNNTYSYIQKEYPRLSNIASPTSPIGGKQVEKVVPECTLDPEVQALIKLIMDVDVMRKQVLAMGINVEELPLGKLTRGQIAKGFAILSQISDAIEQGQTQESLMDLSSAFYSVIPHKTKALLRPPLVKTEEDVKTKLNLLQSLENIRVGTYLLAEAKEEQVGNNKPRHHLDVKYDKLGCKITPLLDSCRERHLIDSYVQQTHNDVDDREFNIKISQVYGLESPCDTRFERHLEETNRQLLWHSSRLGNYAGILSEGLKIAPKEAPSSGFRLGKGIYFADSLQKSSMYCWATEIPSTQCLLLCEVALGKPQKRYVDDMHAEMLEPDCQSTWAVGRRQNDQNSHVEFEPGLKMPTGQETWPVLDMDQPSFFDHNEFVVYDEGRVRPRYLLTVNFSRRR